MCSAQYACFFVVPQFRAFLVCYLNDFEVVRVAQFITGITFALIIVVRRISVISSVYFIIFSSFFITFLSPEMQYL